MSREERANAHRHRPATMEREALIFLHIPKTAGTTLNRIIEWQYSPFAIFTIDPYRIRPTPERLKRLPEERRRRLRVVRGHLFYGIHEFLPQGATYITMLRDPVARVLSAYYFVLRRPLNPLHWKLKRERLGIEDCLRRFPERQNLQCRLIAGVKDTAIADERLLDIAKENLMESFSVVGISERFEESVMLMATTFDWEIPLYKDYKVSKARPQIDPGMVEMIRDHNRLDLELYEFGKGLFEESLQKKEAAVREGLAAFRTLPKPGSMEGFCNSTLGAGRFLVSKIASAV
jgi:Sulfotransferase family